MPKIDLSDIPLADLLQCTDEIFLIGSPRCMDDEWCVSGEQDTVFFAVQADRILAVTRSMDHLTSPIPNSQLFTPSENSVDPLQIITTGPKFSLILGRSDA